VRGRAAWARLPTSSGSRRRCGARPPALRRSRAKGGSRSEDPEQRFPQLVAPPPAPPRDMPPTLAEHLLAGLAREPAERPTARELAGGFEPLLGSLPARAPRGRGRR